MRKPRPAGLSAFWGGWGDGAPTLAWKRGGSTRPRNRLRELSRARRAPAFPVGPRAGPAGKRNDSADAHKRLWAVSPAPPYSDRPIRSPDDDLFNRGPLVRQLGNGSRPACDAELADELAATRASAAFDGDHDFVFANRTGGGLEHRTIGGRIMRARVAAAGLGARSDRRGARVLEAPTSHSLRHSHAPALIAAGFDIEEVSSRLGHANVATTQRIYIHEFDWAGRSSDRRERL